MKNFLIAGLFFLAGIPSVKAQQVVAKTNARVLNEFMDQRFGMFIHWGPVTLRGTEIGWSRNHQVAQNDYDSLYKEFNPHFFNADEWVKTARDAGMKYLTITAKHHDGFCLWPTKFTSYNIMNSPYKKDVVGALANACKKYNIKFCIYYTVLDWYDQRYPVHNNGKPSDPNPDMPKFVQYMKDQLKELVDNYHPYMLWFDGNWEKPWTLEYGKEIYRFLKALNPNLIVNNRLGKGQHDQLGAETVGDYATPEQKIGKLNMDIPWESCITLCQQWAWKPNDQMKSLKQCIQTLASTAGGNGNLLFNVGPMPDGRMEHRQVKRLREIGDWLHQYGESIYNTKGGPYTPDSILAATRKGNKVFIHLFKRESAVLKLPVISGVKVIKAYFLKGAQLPSQQNETHITITLPDILPEANDAVIVLEMDKNIERAPVISR
jgi:alpha-L-fucosidase